MFLMLLLLLCPLYGTKHTYVKAKAQSTLLCPCLQRDQQQLRDVGSRQICSSAFEGWSADSTSNFQSLFDTPGGWHSKVVLHFLHLCAALLW